MGKLHWKLKPRARLKLSECRRSCKLMLLILDLPLSMPLQEMQKPKILSRSISFKLEMPRQRLMKNLLPNLLLLMQRLLLIERLLLCKMHLRRAVLSLRLLIVRDALQNRSLQTLMRPLLILEMSTSLLLLLRGNWKLNSTNLELISKMTNEARLSEEKAARAMVDAARLADELRCEQDAAMSLEKDKKLLEAQCKDAAARADEAEVNALKGGRKAMIKMETRIRELESELDAENRRNGDICKNLRKSERTIKELTFASDEDKKNHERMQALIDQ